MDAVVFVPAMEAERRSLRLGVDAWKPLLTLALCGWTLASDKNANERLWNRLCIKIRCQSCRRCLGLWDYRALFPAAEEEAETGKAPVVAAAGKKLPSPTQDAQEVRRKEKEEKIVAIVTEGKKEPDLKTRLFYRCPQNPTFASLTSKPDFLLLT